MILPVIDDVAPANGLVLAIGEVLWDLLPDGPELGGAPLNLAVHLRRLGRPSAILTAVGDDDLGRQARQAVAGLGVGVTWIQTSSQLATGTAHVTFDGVVPTFGINRPAAYDDLQLDSQTLQEIMQASPAAIAIGTLAQERPQVRAATIRVLDACPDAVRFYDANLRGGWDANVVDELLRSSSVIKLSEDEAVEIARVRGVSGARALIDDLANQESVRAVCVTRGAEGAALMLDGRFVEGRPPAITPIDTVGAGDAFAAALLDGVLAGHDPISTLRRALALGALVSCRRGATPTWEQDDLEAILRATPIPSS